MNVLRKLVNVSLSKLDIAIAWLLVGAIFFCMRSCEYLETNIAEEDRRTKIITLKNIVFKTKGKVIKHSSKNLEKAELVMITFPFQKNDWRSRSVHMFRTNDKILCPVKAWAKTVKRVRSSFPNCDDDQKVCSFKSGEDMINITGNMVRSKLRSIVGYMGEKNLGFNEDEIGLHSIRAGGAMAMFLSGVCEIVIQRVGRWSSFAFLEYIREQVDCFTAGVSQKMLKYEEYQHLSEKESKKVSRNTKLTPNTGNGGDTQDLDVRFSNMVLNKIK